MGVALVLTIGIAPMASGATGDQKCAATKIKAAGKKVFGKARCHQKATLIGTTVDQVCLDKVEAKFNLQIAKADTLGTCAGTASGIEADVDACVATLVGNVFPPTTTTAPPTTSTSSTPTSSTTSTTAPVQCCEFDTSSTFTANCRWETPSDCVAAGGTPGASASVCDGASGFCQSPPAGAGNCCSVSGGEPYCYGGPGVISTSCTSAGGTLSTGTCPAPGTACTAAPTTTTPTSSTTSTTIAAATECCAIGPTFALTCVWTEPGNCALGGGDPGAPGTVCDGATGACVNPPATAGNCCSVPGGRCFSGTGVISSDCTSSGGTLSTGTCLSGSNVCTP